MCNEIYAEHLPSNAWPSQDDVENSVPGQGCGPIVGSFPSGVFRCEMASLMILYVPGSMMVILITFLIELSGLPLDFMA